MLLIDEPNYNLTDFMSLVNKHIGYYLFVLHTTYANIFHIVVIGNPIR